MAKVNYMASTSTAQTSEEPSVEIIDPKLNSISVSFSDELETSDEKNKSLDLEHPNRPSSALWKQQKLPAWQPILTPDTVLPAFFLLGIALIPIGVGLLISSNYVKEVVYDYTYCLQRDGSKCSDIIARGIKKNIWNKCECRINFTIDEDIKAPVFFYYGLSKYYQNHRRYVQSRDEIQLEGKVEKELSKYCDPFKTDKDRPIAPCGAIANSLFNDTFKLYMKISENNLEPIDLAETDIAWPTDRAIKYDNPPMEEWYKYTKPPNWDRSVFALDYKNPDNNGYKNEHLIVWMRNAALPSFRKLWARIDHDQNIVWRTKLPKGNYSLFIDYKYPVINGEWEGSKHFYISNTSWLGGKNNFLGYAYIVVGTLCLILWIIFLIIIKKLGQKPKDIVDIGPKTSYNFTAPKHKDMSDGSTVPLKSGNT